MRERLALTFLILLRVAIGWHFTFEALEKHRSIQIGETVTNRPWTSEGYFREGPGPMAQWVRAIIGDTDELLIERLTPRESAAGPPRDRMPARLEREWNDYLDRFVQHYGVDRSRAEAVLDREKDDFVDWLTQKPGTIGWFLAGRWLNWDAPVFKRKYLPDGSYEVRLSVAERVAEYREKLAEYRSLGDRNFALGKDVEKSRRPQLRAEVVSLRQELQGLLDQRTERMKRRLQESLLSKEELAARGPLPALPKHWFIRFLDESTRWGLLVIGVCLMFGLFSRTAAFAGAVFLILTVLTYPSLPWYPVPPNSEGNYLFISKNVIELIALLMLACIPSGRWFGLDALIDVIFRRNRQNDEQE